MVKIVIALVILLASIGPVSAKDLTEVVGVEATFDNTTITSGEKTSATIMVTIKDGWHINSAKPFQDFLIPTTISLGPTKIAKLESAVYPQGQTKKFEFAEEDLSVYEGTVGIGLLLSLTTKDPTISLPLKVKYQACDQKTCLPPKTIDYQLVGTMTMAKPSEKKK